jgi:hypothetical protein
MSFLKRLLGITELKKPQKIKAERPPEWKSTISDLWSDMKAGKRRSIAQQEFEWAEDYERSLIPENCRFPRKGDLYESLEDQVVDFQTDWAMPYTGAGEGTLLKGERVRIEEPRNDKPVIVSAKPVDYAKLEERMVPKQDRECPKYGRFYLRLKTMDLNTRFRLVKK